MPPKLRALPQTQQRAIIYLRQSIAKDDSISLEMQEIACRDYCDRMGYVVVDVRADPGISGRTWSKRPDVQVAMAAIEGGDADVIVLWKWSRLSRSRRDWALAIDRVDVAGGRIESATEPIDTATASGRFARGVMTEYAAFQSEQIGEVWEEVRQRRLNLGKPVSGRLPFGWRWVKGEGIEPDPEQAPYVVEMYRRYLAGEGSATIARWLNEEGVPAKLGATWNRNRPITVLNSPIHAGLISYRGNVYPGEHKGIISVETRDAYLAERKRRADVGEKPRAYDYLLSLLVVCECGGRMHGKGAVTGGKWYGGYLCGHTLNGHEQRAYISARTIEPAIVKWFMTFDPEVETAEDDDAAKGAQRDRLNRDLNKLEDEIVELTRDRYRLGLPDAAFLRTLDQIKQEIAAKKDALRKLGSPARPLSAQDIATLRGQWDEMTIGEQNDAIRQAVDRIELLPGSTSASVVTQWGRSSVVHF